MPAVICISPVKKACRAFIRILLKEKPLERLLARFTCKFNYYPFRCASYVVFIQSSISKNTSIWKNMIAILKRQRDTSEKFRNLGAFLFAQLQQLTLLFASA